MDRKRSLTGIKPTGTPHIGNYLGAIKPALKLAEDFDAFYFIADYHALNTVKDAKELKTLTYEVAATWLACGLDPEKVIFYKQSSVPETFELSTILMAFTSKGLMNRAHAYKAKVQENQEKDKEPDFGVNMGLFTYPVLMAADILLFHANVVPVGKDQIQHLEMTADIAQVINHTYQKEVLTIPEPLLDNKNIYVTGLDGRKMSKSYNNTIQIFQPEKQFRKTIMRIVTNSQTVDEPKDPDNCNVFALYKLFATAEEQEALRQRYTAGGMGWGDAKQALFEKMNDEFKDMRDKYFELINNRKYLDEVLEQGAEKARRVAFKTMRKLRKAIGAV